MLGFVHIHLNGSGIEGEAGRQSIVENHCVGLVVLHVAGEGSGKLEGDSVVKVMVSGILPGIIRDAVIFAVFDILNLLFHGGQSGLGVDGNGFLTCGIHHDQRICLIAGQIGHIRKQPVALLDGIVVAVKILGVGFNVCVQNSTVNTVGDLTHGAVTAGLAFQIGQDLGIGHTGSGSRLTGFAPQSVSAVIQSFLLQNGAVLFIHGISVVVAIIRVIGAVTSLGMMGIALQAGGQLQQLIAGVDSAVFTVDGNAGVFCRQCSGAHSKDQSQHHKDREKLFHDFDSFLK